MYTFIPYWSYCHLTVFFTKTVRNFSYVLRRLSLLPYCSYYFKSIGTQKERIPPHIKENMYIGGYKSICAACIPVAKTVRTVR